MKTKGALFKRHLNTVWSEPPMKTVLGESLQKKCSKEWTSTWERSNDYVSKWTTDIDYWFFSIV